MTVILMCTTCDECGYKSNEVKSGAAVRDHGCRLTVSVEKVVNPSGLCLFSAENN